MMDTGYVLISFTLSSRFVWGILFLQYLQFLAAHPPLPSRRSRTGLPWRGPLASHRGTIPEARRGRGSRKYATEEGVFFDHSCLLTPVFQNFVWTSCFNTLRKRALINMNGPDNRLLGRLWSFIFSTSTPSGTAMSPVFLVERSIEIVVVCSSRSRSSR